MGKRVLVVVDMQKDFVDGSLGSKEAVSIVPAVVKKARDFDGTVLFTRDTHGEDYMETPGGEIPSGGPLYQGNGRLGADPGAGGDEGQPAKPSALTSRPLALWPWQRL